MTSDPFIPLEQLDIKLDILNNYLDNYGAAEVKNLMEDLIESYKSNSEIVDHLYMEQISTKKYKKNQSFKKVDNNKVIKIR